MRENPVPDGVAEPALAGPHPVHADPESAPKRLEANSSQTSRTQAQTPPAPRRAADGALTLQKAESTAPRFIPSARDVALATVLFLTLGAASWVITLSFDLPTGARVVTVTCLLLAHAAVAWRTAQPVAGAVVIYLAALGHFIAGNPALPSDLLVLLALYSVAATAPKRTSYLALGGAFIGAALQGSHVLVTFGSGGILSAVLVGVLLAALSLATWALAVARRTRLAQMETLAERAARLEVERDQQAMLATAAERARITREMHDIVAHSLSVMIAQADGGRYMSRTDPQAAEQALTTISQAGRAALTDVRRILGVLRGDDPPEHQLAPQPAQEDLTALVTQVRDAGLEASLVTVGEPRPVHPGTGLAVYRIAQESLTNTLKHAGPGARATVLVQWDSASLTLQIDDDGRGAAADDDGAGNGLLGMRERVAMLDGTFVAGPRPGGGFRVRAEIPLPRFTEPDVRSTP